MCNRVTWISDEKVTELFEELADLRGRVNTEYQRGREDAAKAVESVIDYLNSMKMPTTPSWTLWESQLISGCIALARGDVADKTDKSIGGGGSLVSRSLFLPSNAATTHNIDDPEAVVNVSRAAVVNIGEVANVNTAARGESEPVVIQSRWDSDCYCEDCNNPDCGCIDCGVARGDGAE